MSKMKIGIRKLRRAGVLIGAGGLMFAVSCNADGLQAIAAGLGAAASQLDQRDRNDDITFGEWLLDEFD